MKHRNIEQEYFDWMYDLVCPSNDSNHSLLTHLNSVDFTYTIPMDGNRASDGIALRYRFGDKFGYDQREVTTFLDVRPCSVLEMMVALALRCEEHIMGDWESEDRTYQWFNIMLENLGLANMTDYDYDPEVVDHALYILLNRKYRRDGSNGALFVVKHPRQDLRAVEIWYQMNWYLSTII